MASVTKGLGDDTLVTFGLGGYGRIAPPIFRRKHGVGGTPGPRVRYRRREIIREVIIEEIDYSKYNEFDDDIINIGQEEHRIQIEHLENRIKDLENREQSMQYEIAQLIEINRQMSFLWQAQSRELAALRNEIQSLRKQLSWHQGSIQCKEQENPPIINNPAVIAGIGVVAGIGIGFGIWKAFNYLKSRRSNTHP